MAYHDIHDDSSGDLSKAMVWALEHIDQLPAVCMDGEIVLSGRLTSRKIIEFVKQRLDTAANTT